MSHELNMLVFNKEIIQNHNKQKVEKSEDENTFWLENKLNMSDQILKNSNILQNSISYGSNSLSAIAAKAGKYYFIHFCYLV
jgi:hypothetical protein